MRWFLVFLLVPTAAHADFRSSLKKLDPQTRLEQVCELEAMGRIGKAGKSKPDRAKSDVTKSPKVVGHTLVAEGAAFRSKEQWYELAFTCKATADHMKVDSFEYQIGKAIPESKWEEYGLWK